MNYKILFKESNVDLRIRRLLRARNVHGMQDHKKMLHLKGEDPSIQPGKERKTLSERMRTTYQGSEIGG